MAKLRAQRRLEREQHLQRVLEKQARLDTKRRRRREFWRKVTFYEMRRRSTGRLLARRSRGQRAVIAVGALGALVAIWNLSTSTALSVMLTVLLILILPVLVIIAFDKRST